MAALPFSDNELRFLTALLEHDVRFMVVGLSAAALQGAPVVTQNVDLWFEDLGDERMREALHDVGATYIPPLNLNPPMFVGAGAALFDIVLRLLWFLPMSNILALCEPSIGCRATTRKDRKQPQRAHKAQEGG